MKSLDAAQAWAELTAPDTYRVIINAKKTHKINQLILEDALGHPLFTELARTMIENTSREIKYDAWVDAAFEKMREYSRADKSTRDISSGLGKGELYKDIDRIVAATDEGRITRNTAVCMMVDGLEYNIVMAQL
jgi:hypothetical protein